MAELGPSAWPASSLRRVSHGLTGSRDRAGRAAPPVRIPGATPGLSADCKLQRTGRSTDRYCPEQDHDHQEEEEAEDHELPKTRPPWRSACPYIHSRLSPRPPSSSCVKLPERRRYPFPTPRSSLFIAPPSFQLLREASRKEALPISNASPL